MQAHLGPAPDLTAVRDALRAALESRGHAVGGDTAGFKGDLYIWGDGDRARALFETKTSAAEAAETMYQGQGRWTADLPPRVAVIPASEEGGWMIDMLRQAGILTLGFTVSEDAVTFPGLDDLLAGFEG